ncbi:zinc-binding metallopeptidase family protein [Marinomonas transparens]|uniref:Zinc-binding peptidase n=1 Tax=Marinomonas transparens TaxID=2795388 RepID=A0A934JUX0_9GAMM|nr:putative zinc-binding peptidase [Marinomonas transparens]MBJ7538742.1 putative zinc-binding peptidase [Marinomonas transparens]
MKIFSCQQCNQTVLFENTMCMSCGSELGFIPEQMILSALKPVDGGYQALADMSSPPKVWRYCDNHQHNVCNWLVDGQEEDELCMACELNRHIPNLGRIEQLQAWQQLESAKHQLVYSLLQLNLPIINKQEDPEDGLSFDFISEENVVPEDAQATTGHALGQVTINALEANAADRERMRSDMKESYRTLIGHFRHEVGHYYWDQLVVTDEVTLMSFRALFGDEQVSYADALEKHYETPNDKWQENYVSVYASSHPWEDWAETWAHYLHIVDTLETASQFGFSLQPLNPLQSNLAVMVNIDPYNHANFDDILAQYLPLTFAVNNLNRSMGQPDLYPFIIVPAVREKLKFIHELLYQG